MSRRLTFFPDCDKINNTNNLFLLFLILVIVIIIDNIKIAGSADDVFRCTVMSGWCRRC